MNETDKKVRDIFSNLITKFAYLNAGQSTTKNKAAFQDFDSDQSNFIRIGSEVSLDKDFRYEYSFI